MNPTESAPFDFTSFPVDERDPHPEVDGWADAFQRLDLSDASSTSEAVAEVAIGALALTAGPGMADEVPAFPDPSFVASPIAGVATAQQGIADPYAPSLLAAAAETPVEAEETSVLAPPESPVGPGLYTEVLGDILRHLKDTEDKLVPLLKEGQLCMRVFTTLVRTRELWNLAEAKGEARFVTLMTKLVANQVNSLTQAVLQAMSSGVATTQEDKVQLLDLLEWVSGEFSDLLGIDPTKLVVIRALTTQMQSPVHEGDLAAYRAGALDVHLGPGPRTRELVKNSLVKEGPERGFISTCARCLEMATAYAMIPGHIEAGDCARAAAIVAQGRGTTVVWALSLLACLDAWCDYAIEVDALKSRHLTVLYTLRAKVYETLNRAGALLPDLHQQCLDTLGPDDERTEAVRLAIVAMGKMLAEGLAKRDEIDTEVTLSILAYIGRQFGRSRG